MRKKYKLLAGAAALIALVGGNTATAVALSGDEAPSNRSSIATSVGSHETRGDDGRDDAEDGTDTAVDEWGLGKEADDSHAQGAQELTAERAAAMAREATGGTVVELEYDGGWEAEVISENGLELEVQVETSTVTKDVDDNDDNDDKGDNDDDEDGDD